jgi:RNA polymerase sigma factor (sigma-70 family)
MNLKLPKEKEYLVFNNMGIVYHLVSKKMKPLPSDYEDYIQEGMVGLIISAIRFDESRGFSFSTYAFRVILGVLKRYKRENVMVHQSRSAYNNYNKIISYKLEHPEADNDEIIKQLDLSSNEFLIAQAYYSIEYLDNQIENDKGQIVSLLDTIPDKDAYREIQDRMDEECIIRLADRVLADATERSRGIYDDFFYPALLGEKVSQAEIAKKYGVVQAQVSRIIKKYNKIIKQCCINENLLY